MTNKSNTPKMAFDGLSSLLLEKGLSSANLSTALQRPANQGTEQTQPTPPTQVSTESSPAQPAAQEDKKA